MTTIPTSLSSEAYRSIQEARTSTERNVLIMYYISLAFAIGYDAGRVKHTNHSMKPVQCWDDKSYRKFKSVREASRIMKANYDNIVKAIKYKRKCNGYKWKYI